MIATIDADGKAWLRLQPIGKPDAPETDFQTIESGSVPPFEPGVGKRVELWYVDSQASLWVDGTEVLVHNFDPPSIEAAIKRVPCGVNPDIAIRLQGAPATLSHVDVDRDIYYTAVTSGGYPGWGVITKNYTKVADDRLEWVQNGEPIRLGPDQFFCLGDNSPMSQDGRLWTTADPWVEAELLNGKPQKYGIVPRELLMGRAFFVYFPAPFSWPKGSFPIIPNFADMRLIK
jgi:signal peptidase I